MHISQVISLSNSKEKVTDVLAYFPIRNKMDMPMCICTQISGYSVIRKQMIPHCVVLV